MCNLVDNNFITKYYLIYMYVQYSYCRGHPYLLCSTSIMVLKLAQKLFSSVSHVLANCSVTFCESFLLVLRFMVSD